MKFFNINGIALALSYLHKKNILHHDIKPDNVLINTFIFPKVSDFGISIKFNNESEIKPIFNGTYPFISPETIKILQ